MCFCSLVSWAVTELMRGWNLLYAKLQHPQNQHQSLLTSYTHSMYCEAFISAHYSTFDQCFHQKISFKYRFSKLIFKLILVRMHTFQFLMNKIPLTYIYFSLRNAKHSLPAKNDVLRIYANIHIKCFFHVLRMLHLSYATVRETFHSIVLKMFENVTFECSLNVQNTH